MRQKVNSLRQTERLVRIEERMNAAKYREDLEENLLQSVPDLRLDQRFTSQHNNPKHTARATLEWLQVSVQSNVFDFHFGVTVLLRKLMGKNANSINVQLNLQYSEVCKN